MHPQLCELYYVCMYVPILNFENKRAYEPISGSLNLTRLRYMMHVYSKFLYMVNSSQLDESFPQEVRLYQISPYFSLLYKTISQV